MECAVVDGGGVDDDSVHVVYIVDGVHDPVDGDAHVVRIGVVAAGVADVADVDVLDVVAVVAVVGIRIAHVHLVHAANVALVPADDDGFVLKVVFRFPSGNRCSTGISWVLVERRDHSRGADCLAGSNFQSLHSCSRFCFLNFHSGSNFQSLYSVS